MNLLKYIRGDFYDYDTLKNAYKYYGLNPGRKAFEFLKNEDLESIKAEIRN